MWWFISAIPESHGSAADTSSSRVEGEGQQLRLLFQSLLIDVWDSWSCTSIRQDHHYAYRERRIRTTFPKIAAQPCFCGDTATHFQPWKPQDLGADKATELSFWMLCSTTSQYFTTYLKGDKIIGSFVSSTYNVHFQVCLVAQLWNLSVLK